MRIGNIDITPQIDNTYTVSIDGRRQINRVPEAVALEFIQFGHSLGYIKTRDRDAAVKYFEKPPAQNLEAVVNSQLMTLIATLNMVHESIDPDDIDDEAKYSGQYLKAAEVLAKLSKCVDATEMMCRHLHDEETGAVKPVTTVRGCSCANRDPDCGAVDCPGMGLNKIGVKTPSRV